jgi:thiaminase/transcriptional activator TenA
MSERFTEILRAASEPAWSDALGHRFVKELFAGAVPDAVMAHYLIQDHRFLDSFLTLLGAALASADAFEARVRFGRFIGMVAGEENRRTPTSCARSRCSASRRSGARPLPICMRLPASRQSCAKPQKRAAMPPRFRSSLWPSGSIWTGLPARRSRYLPDKFVHAEWIMLHDNPDFRDFVGFLRAELDRIGPEQADLCHDFSVGLSPWNSPFSKPLMPTGPDNNVFDRVKAPTQKGTEGSNPAPSSGESANHRSLNEPIRELKS